jgi:hypothetical protein
MLKKLTLSAALALMFSISTGATELRQLTVAQKSAKECEKICANRQTPTERRNCLRNCQTGDSSRKRPPS